MSPNTPAILQQAFAAALQLAEPRHIMANCLQQIFPVGTEPQGRCLVVGAGKASAAMASALEAYAVSNWPKAQLEGLVLTRYGHGAPTQAIRIVEAGHPVPDQAGMDGAIEILRRVQELQAGETLIVLVSGGGSSLLTLPQSGISMADMRQTTEALLRSGAPIEEMNIVRKHLSAILGGNLARSAMARGARVEALLISDVTGDHPADIASGPCAADYSSYDNALAILAKYNLDASNLPVSVLQHLQDGRDGKIPETLKEADLVGAQVRNHVIATARQSLQAAANFIASQGYTPIILGDTITGEAHDVASVHAAIAREIILHQQWAKLPVALISGGECTVTIPAEMKGRGGRCSEFLLALFAASSDLPNISALAADTDGIDGSEFNAGAWFTPAVRKLAKERNLNPTTFLMKHDCYGFFAELNALVDTGPTLTNVNDFRIILLEKN